MWPNMAFFYSSMASNDIFEYNLFTIIKCLRAPLLKGGSIFALVIIS